LLIVLHLMRIRNLISKFKKYKWKLFFFCLIVWILFSMLRLADRTSSPISYNGINQNMSQGQSLETAEREETPRTPMLWPLPTFAIMGQSEKEIDPSTFRFRCRTASRCPPILQRAFERIWKRMFYAGVNTNVTNSTRQLDSVVVSVENETLLLDDTMQETYSLLVLSNQTEATIEAKSVWGALRGLQTFSQLVEWDRVTNVYKVLGVDTQIYDFPRFLWRGLLLDTSRHFVPVNTILRQLDALEMNKMNVLHWHISDDESFPLLLKSLPLLAANGAWQLFTLLHRTSLSSLLKNISKRTPHDNGDVWLRNVYRASEATYSDSDVRRIVDEARDRGIRVVPEFDTPGHVYSWTKAYPFLVSPLSITHCHHERCRHLTSLSFISSELIQISRKREANVNRI